MITTRKATLFLVALSLGLCLSALATAGEYHIIRVVDGDTLEVDHLSKRFIVRLVGIDAPELGSGKHKPRAVKFHGVASFW
jgi:endonuclease YncB( thermonuclease family)